METLSQNCSNTDNWLVIISFIVNLLTVFFIILRARLVLESRIAALETYVKILLRAVRMNPSAFRATDNYRQDFDDESG